MSTSTDLSTMSGAKALSRINPAIYKTRNRKLLRQRTFPTVKQKHGLTSQRKLIDVFFDKKPFLFETRVFGTSFYRQGFSLPTIKFLYQVLRTPLKFFYANTRSATNLCHPLWCSASASPRFRARGVSKLGRNSIHRSCL